MGDATPATPATPVLVRRRAAFRSLPAACHPAPICAVTVMATALALGCGHTWRAVVLIGLAVLAGQLSVGWGNDWLDAQRDRATGRRDKPIVAGPLRPRTVGVAAGAALAVCVPLSAACGLAAALAHLTGVAGGWAYNLGLKRTLWSWLPYAASFGLLPAFVTLALPGRAWPPWWALIAGALLGVGAHFANVLPDIADDMATGVRGLPQRLGTGGVRLLAPLPPLAATAVLACAPPGPPGAAGLCALAAGTLLTAAGIAARPAWGGRDDVSLRVCVAVAAIDVTLVFSHAGHLA
jgi:4-hydroxybenzoate polyprenyltransferase